MHDERRPFVVLSDLRFNGDPNWQVVLGCPASSSTQFRTELCVRLAAGEANVPQEMLDTSASSPGDSQGGFCRTAPAP